jgi:hypothetical protein
VRQHLGTARPWVEIRPFRPISKLLWPNYRGIRLLNGSMQVRVLPAAPFPLPDSVKVARRSVNPLVLVRVQVWQPFCGRQADRSWLHLSRKQDLHLQRSERYRRLPPILNPSNQRRSYASRNQIPKSVALSQELSTETKQCESTGAEAEPVVPPIARRSNSHSNI